MKRHPVITRRFGLGALVALGHLLSIPPAVAEPVRVACVGDSITWGAAIANRDRDSYPAVLGRLLGDGWEVRNFGRGGATAMNVGGRPYPISTQFQEATAFNPQRVVIMLGTNDSKPENWKHRDRFKDDLGALVDHFAGLPAKPMIWLCTPAWVARSIPGGITEEVVGGEVVPMVRALAGERGLPLIDTHAALEGKVELFPENDGVHPNEAGARILAQTVHRALAGGQAAARPPAPVGSFRELLDPFPVERIKPWRTLQASSGLIDRFEDYGNFLREEPKGHYVLMDVQGAGCIDRFWCVYKKGRPQEVDIDLLVYIDGQADPAINIDLNDLFDGKRTPFVAPLVGRCGFEDRQSSYSHVPIGFSKSCKVVAVPRDPAQLAWRDRDGHSRSLFIFFYQLTYRLCRPEVPVKVFSAAPDAADRAALAEIRTRWADAGRSPWSADTPASGQSFEKTLELGAGKAATLWRHDAPGTLRELRIRLDPPDDSVATRRRLADSLRLEMTWDDAETPQVSVPLGVFFLAPDFTTDIKAICLGCRDGEYYSFLPMPFFRNAHLRIRSAGEPAGARGAVSVAAKVRWTAAPPAADACHFHARRYSHRDLPAGRNVLMLDTRHPGHVVGIAIDHQASVENDDCWIFDGEQTPSVYGTGTEDFFSFAWGLGDLQALPLHGVRVPFGPPSKRGQRTDTGLAYRFHPFAGYPFRKSLQLSWIREDVRHPDPGPYSGIVYHYLSPPQQDPPPQ